MKKIVYVTGCLGFIGYHVTKRCLDAGFYVYGVDKQTYASNVQFLPELLQHPQFRYSDCDINDIERLVDCDYVINTAAETHVDNSIISNDVFLKSNINGVHHLLNLIQQKSRFNMPTLLHFSTDEVYGDIDEGAHTEDHLLKPSNPYSATKAAADMLVMAWGRTHNVPYMIIRPTNNYGIGQYVEKLIPKAVKCLSLGRKIPLHNNGTPYRNWLHANDTAEAVITLIENGKIGEIYNVAGGFEQQNIDTVSNIIEAYYEASLPYKIIEEHIDFSCNRPGQDVRYALDDSKIRALGWEPESVFFQEIPRIVNYYKDKFIW
jgi:dTDP-glucose 4,6-dehydratase